jgi:hypothetical protein
MKHKRTIIGLFLMLAAVAMGGVPLKPAEFNCVFDYGNMLKPEEAQLIRIAGNYIRAKSKAELVVVTVENLDGMVLEDYAHELFNTWGIGDKEKNNGVLLLVNKETTLAGTSGRVRIEVGYGLEGALPDSVCGRILDEKTLPAWDKKEYGRGIVDGYMELVRRTAMEYTLDMPQELMDACGMKPLWCNVVERPDRIPPRRIGLNRRVVVEHDCRAVGYHEIPRRVIANLDAVGQVPFTTVRFGIVRRQEPGVWIDGPCRLVRMIDDTQIPMCNALR